MPRILLIGDHEAFRRELEAAADLAGCEIASAGGNVDAVRHVRARAIVYHFRDPGPGFTMDRLEQSALSNTEDDPIAHLERRAEMGLRPGGFGILVTRQVVDEMFYNERGNQVVLIKRLA